MLICWDVAVDAQFRVDIQWQAAFLYAQKTACVVYRSPVSAVAVLHLEVLSISYLVVTLLKDDLPSLRS